MARVEIPITVIDLAGNAVSGAAVRVKDRANGTDRTLYANETGVTTVSNPLITNAAGRVDGWVDEGRHAAIITGTGINPYTEPFDAVAAFPASVIPTANALPTTPVDGDVVVYQASTDVLWRLRYNAASSSSFKWEFVGGNPLRATVAGPLAVVASATPFTLVSIASGPQITLPMPGDYEVDWACVTQATAATSLDVRVGARIGAGNVAAGTAGPSGSHYAANAMQSLSYHGRIDNRLDASAAGLWLNSVSPSLAVSVYDMTLAITPVRVSN